MANTYTQLYIQLVFAVKYRDSMIKEPIRERVEKYVSGIVQNKGHKLLAIYSMPDHIHLLVGLNPHQSISELVRDVKSNSSKMINQEKLTPSRFSWQSGFGAFSYSREQLCNVINYIRSQPEHHKKSSFQQEYMRFLKESGIEYKDEYLFNWLE
ncbi:MAG: IS200/IS605 family transposase [Bacteroidetes bacterium]|nr:IS200/IS605 family transposase [Bacteroidota bacterium]